jgi:hypothetical protein
LSYGTINKRKDEDHQIHLIETQKMKREKYFFFDRLRTAGYLLEKALALPQIMLMN